MNAPAVQRLSTDVCVAPQLDPAAMTDIARQAHEWRKNYYLSTRPAATDGAIDLLAQFA